MPWGLFGCGKEVEKTVHNTNLNYETFTPPTFSQPFSPHSLFVGTSQKAQSYLNVILISS